MLLTGDIEMAKEIAGHKSTDTTLIYILFGSSLETCLKYLANIVTNIIEIQDKELEKQQKLDVEIK